MATIFIYISKEIHLLDLSGVVQVFQEAQNLGFNYTLEFISQESDILSSSGLRLSSLVHYSKVKPNKSDIVFIPGFGTNQKGYSDEDLSFFEWLRKVNFNSTTICSICTGAFLLAKAGLLDHKECTTHWKYIDELQLEFSLLKTQKNRLFVKSENIYSSAGVTTGIDLALFIIEERHGTLNAIKIAKELAVYLRRNGTDQQISVFMQFRNHNDSKVHEVQDWIIHNLDKTFTLESLASMVHTSSRNLTRIFKHKTGITIANYRTKLRIEKALTLLSNSNYKTEHIAHLCGLKTSKQLRLILEKYKNDCPVGSLDKVS